LVKQVKAELGQVAGIDELHRFVPLAKRDHLAAPRRTEEPIGEAVRPVIGSDDHPGADDQCVRPVCILHFLLAERLETAVGLGVHHLDGWIFEGIQRVRLNGVGMVHARVHADRGDEEVLGAAAFEDLAGLLHDPGHIAARVDHPIPSFVPEGREPAIPIAEDVPDVREIRTALPSVEDGDFMTEQEGPLDDMPAHENGAAEDEDSHRARLLTSVRAVMPSVPVYAQKCNAAQVQILTNLAGSNRVQKSVSLFIVIHISTVPGLWGRVLGPLGNSEVRRFGGS
jgi:hypothetical protein